MGRVGSSGDNEAIESFFALLQKNVLDRRSWTTREQPRAERKSGRFTLLRLRGAPTDRPSPSLLQCPQKVCSVSALGQRLGALA